MNDDNVVFTLIETVAGALLFLPAISLMLGVVLLLRHSSSAKAPRSTDIATARCYPQRMRSSFYVIVAVCILFLALSGVVAASIDAGLPLPTAPPVAVTAQVTQTEAPASQWTQLLNEILKAVVLVIVLPILTLLGKKLHDWIDAKVKNEKVRGVLNRLDDAAVKVVQDVAQRGVGALDVSKSAKFNAGAAKAAAMESLKTHLGGDAGAAELKKVLGLPDDKAVADVMSTAIESSVLDLKRTAPAKNGASQ